jgi:hypothetical protein
MNDQVPSLAFTMKISQKAGFPAEKPQDIIGSTVVK